MVDYGLIFFGSIMIILGILMYLFRTIFAHLTWTRYHLYGGSIIRGPRKVSSFKETAPIIGIGLIVGGIIIIIISYL